MCGFVAMLALEGAKPDPVRLARMTDILRHRGPDDDGISIDGSVGFGFRRLSILDLSRAGHQPMRSEDGLLTVVYNGEIYNYVELRSELAKLGYRFRSTGDTEVLLNAYRAWGAACVERMNGMWAFVIHDRQHGKLFGARDRFGIKPLFRWHGRDVVILASEIKSIRASGLCETRVNPRVMSAFLAESRLDESHETFFDAILQVPPAHAFEIDLAGRYREWRYWTIPSEPESDMGDPALAFAELFEDSMRLHMRSDVPVAVHLSGGLDSTSIACASARIRNEAAATSPLFAFCYSDPRFDEREYVAATVGQTGARKIGLEASPLDLWQCLPQVLWHQDEPVHSMTALVGFRLMQLTSQHDIKVILNGQGADETLGGYPSYFSDYWLSLLANGSPSEAWREIRRYAKLHGGSPLLRAFNLVRYAVQGGLGRSAAYRALSDRRWRKAVMAQDWLHQDVRAEVERSSPPPHGLDAVLRHSVTASPLPLYLRVEDRNSSAHSIEARVPFLDHRLVSLAFSLAPQWRLRGPWNKFVLREAMKGRIPEVVRVRPDKMGFPTAAAAWFRGELYEPLRHIIEDASFRSLGYFDQARMRQMLEQHRAGAADHSDALFKSAQIYYWQKGLAADPAGSLPSEDATTARRAQNVVLS